MLTLTGAGDIKPENFVFTSPHAYADLKLIDFGISIRVDGVRTRDLGLTVDLHLDPEVRRSAKESAEQPMVRQIRGSLPYMAPEMLLSGNYTCFTHTVALKTIHLSTHSTWLEP